ncbi:chorismate mutase [Saccharopolyspora mangrovi]|uniref:Chorismate mutase n=1 Tax=Saccharopolyspora mangrovi TaxID=3082379 RepID=A0ABU6A4J7_9PSEU|nr:chorismate mutase [Saccharopolyspora sp. S2-29]MEB3366349.1 chorismate mutase [Saccharopolyspora sp. S2-29]
MTGTNDHASDSLEQVRADIDEVDRKLVDLLAARGRCVQRAATFKRNEAEVRGPQPRIDHIITRARAAAVETGANPDVVEATFRAMIKAFIDAELAIHATLDNDELR